MSSSYAHFTPRLAGLDTPNSLQLNQPHESYVLVATKEIHQDFSPVSPANSVSPVTGCATLVCKPLRPSSRVRHEHLRLSIPQSLSSFRPLPSLQSMQSLTLPSFSEFNGLAPSSSSPFPLPSPYSPALGISDTLADNGNKSSIPIFEHPNSPYVPWTQPVRREIFGPTSPYSPVYSRSGARAPEPTISEEDYIKRTKGVSKIVQPLKKIGSTFKSLTSSLRKNLKSSTNKKRTTYPPPPLDAVFDDYLPTPTPFRSSFTMSPIRRAHSGNTRSSINVSLHGHLRTSFSVPQDITLVSSESVESHSLTDWLVARQQALSRELSSRLRKGEFGMTVEEYERYGSWLNISAVSQESSPSPRNRSFSMPIGHTMVYSPSIASLYPTNANRDEMCPGGDSQSSIQTPTRPKVTLALTPQTRDSSFKPTRPPFTPSRRTSGASISASFLLTAVCDRNWPLSPRYASTPVFATSLTLPFLPSNLSTLVSVGHEHGIACAEDNDEIVQPTLGSGADATTLSSEKHYVQSPSPGQATFTSGTSSSSFSPGFCIPGGW